MSNTPAMEYSTLHIETSRCFGRKDSSPSSNHGFGPIPEKRQKRAAFVSTSLSLVIMVLLLGTFTRPMDLIELEPVGQPNASSASDFMKCKRRNNEYYHVGLFIWALNLVGIILGEFTNRLCLIFEEYFHLHTRYNGSVMNMLKACFSDISFKAVLFAAIFACVIIVSTLLSQGVEYFKLEYIEIILSGIGSGSLVVYLLSLDTLSRVQISSLMENNNRLVANGLAWSFYFGYLKIILPDLQQRISESPWAEKLSSKKLFILLPSDCYAFGKLSEEDDAIERAGDDAMIEYDCERAGVFKRSYRNVVYNLNKGGKPLYILVQYATPLCSLFDMSHSAEANLSAEDRDEQAKLFLRTLETILENPSEPGVLNKCKLVPYGRKEGIRLSQVLREAVREEEERGLTVLENCVH